MNRERFLARATGDDIEAAKAGLVKIFALLGQFNDAVIVLPNAASMKSDMLASALGNEIATRLTRDREINFPDGKSLRLCFEATLKNFRRSEAYLALWGSKFLIQEIESLPNCKAVVLVTWLLEDSKEWEKTHSIQRIYP